MRPIRSGPVIPAFPKMSCSDSVLTGMDGAFWYTPAATHVCLPADAFPATGGIISVGKWKGYRVDDPVELTYPVGAVVTNAIAAGQYFVKTYDETTGQLTISATKGGTIATATAKPSNFGSSTAEIVFSYPFPVGKATAWTFQVSRGEIDVTTIGQKRGKNAPFRTFQPSYADGNGTVTVLFNNDPFDIANRIVGDALRFDQLGCGVQLFMSEEYDEAGEIDEAASRFISMPAVLTSANFGVQVDGAQTVDVNFRPSGDVTVDLSRTA